MNLALCSGFTLQTLGGSGRRRISFRSQMLSLSFQSVEPVGKDLEIMVLWAMGNVLTVVRCLETYSCARSRWYEPDEDHRIDLPSRDAYL